MRGFRTPPGAPEDEEAAVPLFEHALDPRSDLPRDLGEPFSTSRWQFSEVKNASRRLIDKALPAAIVGASCQI